MLDYWAKTWFIMKITKSRTVLLKLNIYIYIYCLHSDSNLYQVNLIYLCGLLILIYLKGSEALNMILC